MSFNSLHLLLFVFPLYLLLLIYLVFAFLRCTSLSYIFSSFLAGTADWIFIIQPHLCQDGSDTAVELSLLGSSSREKKGGKNTAVARVRLGRRVYPVHTVGGVKLGSPSNGLKCLCMCLCKCKIGKVCLRGVRCSPARLAVRHCSCGLPQEGWYTRHGTPGQAGFLLPAPRSLNRT